MAPQKYLAIAILIISSPLLLAKVPWLIPTIESLRAAISELGIEGTPEYVEGRSERILNGSIAIVLYALGLISVIGIFGVALAVLNSPKAILAVWALTILTSLFLVTFELRSVGWRMDSDYALIFILLPVLIFMVSAVALVYNLRKCRIR